MDQHGRKLIQKRLADKSWYSPVHRFCKPGDQPIPKPWMTGQASYARAGFAPHQNPLNPSNPWNPSSSTLPPSSSQVSTGDGTGARRRSMRVVPCHGSGGGSSGEEVGADDESNHEVASRREEARNEVTSPVVGPAGGLHVAASGVSMVSEWSSWRSIEPSLESQRRRRQTGAS